jgi:hypothetical protein
MWRLWVVLALLGLAMGLVVLAAVAGFASQGCTSGSGPVGGVPAALVPIFEGAASRYNLGPEGAAILASINYEESDFGESTLPGVHSGANSAGAAGPMQIGIGGAAGDTWSAIEVSAPGDPPGEAPDVYDEGDAVYSAAHYLASDGMTADPSTWPGAVFDYNHADWYVSEVLALARSYAGGPIALSSVDCAPLETTAGDQAEITRQGVALAPADAPLAVQQLIAAGNQIISKPYPVPDQHYGSLDQLWPAYDCSGSTSYVLYKAGLLSDGALVAAQFTAWGQPGPGRWVTIYANEGHVFIDVAGIVLNTAWYTPVQPSWPPSGPRWQPASTIPAQIRGDVYGGFTERHPAGL